MRKEYRVFPVKRMFVGNTLANEPIIMSVANESAIPLMFYLSNKTSTYFSEIFFCVDKKDQAKEIC